MNVTGERPKLIEVALPLAAINAEAAREKSIRQGHPSTLHLWWARRPLVAARAVIWASLVDDPSAEEYRDPDGNLLLTAEAQEAERQRLFRILERLVKWENSDDAEILAAARAEIERAFPDGPPPILDPFAGGGAIPLEAQRLGLTALAGDLNPVAVLINKATIEIPRRFAGLQPVHPDIDKSLTTWERTQGLAADVEAYGRWMRDEAKVRIGHSYPDAIGADGEKLTPIAWIWARTVESPDPSWSGQVPLVASWTLSKKKGKPTIWIEPIVDRETQSIRYEIREGGEPARERTVNRGNGTCIATGAAIPAAHIRSEGQSGRMSAQLMATVAEGRPTGRVYRAASSAEFAAAQVSAPDGVLTSKLDPYPRSISVELYGLDEWHKLFTPRQLSTLAAFCDLLPEVAAEIRGDAAASGWPDDGTRLRDGGRGATAYADAILTYLAFAIDKMADLGNSLVAWEPIAQCPRHLFGRQSIPMVWDFAEANPFSASSGSFMTCVAGVTKGLLSIGPLAGTVASVAQRDARVRLQEAAGAVVSTDPPYYDNVGYANLSDFFYVWLRRSLSDVWPSECATLLTPKSGELIANVRRAGSKEAADAHFENGMAEFMTEVGRCQPVDVPATIYYAYKATENRGGDVRSTGWDTFLQAVIGAGLQVTATWPLRTENASRLDDWFQGVGSPVGGVRVSKLGV